MDFQACVCVQQLSILSIKGDHWDEIEEIFQEAVEEGEKIKQVLSERKLVKQRPKEQFDDEKKKIQQTNIKSFFR